MKVALEKISELALAVAWTGCMFYIIMGAWLWFLGVGLAAGLFLTGLPLVENSYEIGATIIKTTLHLPFIVILKLFVDYLYKKYFKTKTLNKRRSSK